MGRKIIAVDFDGTLCINQDVVNWPYLEQAVAWCRNFCGINFEAVNDNIEATKTFFGGNSRKISCDYYIDDKGCTPDVFYKLLQ